MTETCSGISGFWVNKNKDMIDSVGKPFSQTKIKISDSKIIVSGPSVSSLIDKPANKENYTFETSDAGILKKGFLFIKGRTDDTIIVSGENVSLSLIKNILFNHKQILNLYLTYEDDDYYGSKITAYIELTDDKLNSNDIMDYCRKYLSKTQCPHDIQIVEKINHV